MARATGEEKNHRKIQNTTIKQNPQTNQKTKGNPQQVTRTLRVKQQVQVMSINFRYTGITIHVKQKLSKTSTVSTDPVSRTAQNTLFSYREASWELSWVLSHVFIMVFSE